MIKYSFCLSYIDRAPQFVNTLVSFAEHYGMRDDVELSIVEDIKNFENFEAHERFLNALKLLPSSFPIITSVGGELNRIDPGPMYNQAVEQARGKYVMIFSSEMLHLYDTLSELDKIYQKDKDAYIMVACIHGTDCSRDIASVAEFKYTHARWYQHSQHRNCERPFFICVSRAVWKNMGGFDEAYADGWGYGDDDWRNKLKAAGIKTTHLDSHPVVHQEHTKWTSHPRYRAMIARNKDIYEKRWPNV